jgi:GNAT superfamily N-acetyltransferase
MMTNHDRAAIVVHPLTMERWTARALLSAAVEYAREHGATAFEGYPVRPRGSRMDNSSAFPGAYSVYAEAGFAQIPSVAPARSSQMIMRRDLER